MDTRILLSKRNILGFLAGTATLFAACAEEEITQKIQPCSPTGHCEFLISSLKLSTQSEGGDLIGFNLDQEESNGDGEGGCSSNWEDGVNQEYGEGIDNQLVSLLTDAIGDVGSGGLLGTAEALLNDTIRDGGFSIGFRFDSWDTATNSGRGSLFQAKRTVPMLIGTDGEILSYQSVAPYATDVTQFAMHQSPDQVSYETDFWQAEIFMRILRAEAISTVSGGKFRFGLTEDNQVEGIFGAAISLDTFIQLAYYEDGTVSDEQFRQISENLIPLFADVDGDLDGECDAISLAVEFEAKPVFVVNPQ